MKSLNDLNIKEKFETQQIKPSAQAWDKLAGLLDEQMPVTEQEDQKIIPVYKKQTNYKRIFSLAAVLLCVLGFVFWTLKPNATEVLETQSVVESNTQETPVITDHSLPFNETIDVTKKNNLTNSNSEFVTNTALAATSANVIEITPNINNFDSIKKTVTSKNLNQITIAWEPLQTSTIDINTNKLLQNVERELYMDRAESEYKNSKSKFEQIKTAYLNRNIQD